MSWLLLWDGRGLVLGDRASKDGGAINPREVKKMLGFDLLIYLALGLMFIVIAVAAWVIKTGADDVDLEVTKIRFAAATFMGILMLFVFTAVLYYTDPDGTTRGKDIFKTAVTAMTPLAGAIIGYIFGSRGATEKNGNETTDGADS